MNKNRAEQLQEVVAALCARLLGGAKEQQRDVASLGLKTVVAGAPWLCCACAGLGCRLGCAGLNGRRARLAGWALTMMLPTRH